MFARLLSLAVVTFFTPAFAIADPGVRGIVAQSNSPTAAFTARAANGNVFHIIPEKADIYSGDLLVSLPGATLTAKNGAVAVKTLADFDGRSPLPILETAYSLAQSPEKDKDVDLELVLDRGRINITNVKPVGVATVRVRFGDQSWKVILDSPKTQVTFELCGRWTAGTRFQLADPKADPAKAPGPIASLVFLVLSGSASVDVGGVTVAMRPPPGPAELRWNSVAGVRAQAQKLDKFPSWADPEAVLSDEAQKLAGACERFRKSRADDAATAFDTFLGSADPINQRVALINIGGLDDVERLEKTLGSAKTIPQWDFGVTVLRHWLGRTRGNDQQLYQLLTTRAGYTDAQSRIVLQLLLGFSADDLSQPETFEVLIDYLGNSKPVIRNLAAWHLVRLVPQGKTLAFKPNATGDEAMLYQLEWKKLVPSGKLPAFSKKP